MLVFTRKSDQSVVVGGPSDFERMLRITVLEVRDGRVKLGLDVSEDVEVHRWGVWKRIRVVGGLDHRDSGGAELEA